MTAMLNSPSFWIILSCCAVFFVGMFRDLWRQDIYSYRQFERDVAESRRRCQDIAGLTAEDHEWLKKWCFDLTEQEAKS